MTSEERWCSLDPMEYEGRWRRLIALYRQLCEVAGDIDVVELLEALASLYPLPHWAVSNSFREWIRNVLGVWDTLAGITVTAFDDKLASVLRAIVDCDDAWEKFHGLFFDVIKLRELGVEGIEGDRRCDEIVDAIGIVGVDPTPRTNSIIILAIVKALLELIVFLRPKKKTE